ncbi:uncharacterized protein LOC103964681 [Pyrus x bretschneideri]|uniref:uncharacterized protein LOC103964681 n=1 Tax=Pyrus x bretschneideri TaxID=225117 RepID=UPI00202E6B70|nr:uncharacterized protein LOC103964681 [Pyrus x bretschneideri]XP_048420724.1 uncharacterized protein LOC103964681 [Pyrus x bretschneideri]
MENQVQYHQYECLLFDLDDTLYPLSSGISVQITKNIKEYMIQKLGMDESEVPELCISLYKDYGTTMAGLKAQGYNFDYDDFHSFVHGRLPYELFTPDPVLRGLLLSLPIRKVIFTNSDKKHADTVLKRLGIEDCFESVICFETLNPTNNADDSVGAEETEHIEQPNTGAAVPKTPVVCKPFELAYEEAFKFANIEPQRTLFFDDSIRNIQTAKQCGLHTVLVGTSHRPKGVDYALESIHNMKEALPELWEITTEQSENVQTTREIAIEQLVEA